MRSAAFAVIFLTATSAMASPEDDYVACLIGQSAVALQAQTEQKDAEKAQEIAYSKCPEPNFSPDTVIDGLEDFVHLSVVSIAEGMNGQ